ncbi:MAG: hypothetical protein JNJ54_34735 [Myxococcaceae bacterium]|nr:hypothetical protein [Myxococcaceae bacterium]
MRKTRFAALVAVLAASAALAQEDGGLSVQPAAANPGGADAPGELIRSGFDADAGEPVAEPWQQATVPPQESPTDAGTEKEPSPPLELTAALAASARISYQGATPFPLDDRGPAATVAPLLTRVRVTPEIRLKGFGLVGEADTATGAIIGVPSAELVGTRVPYPAITALDLRKLFVEYKWASGAFRVGLQTQSWGLGLLANDGAKDPEAGDFGQQQFGNTTYRALFAVRPLFQLGGMFRAFETALAADLINRDNFGEFVKGDRAFQGVIALRLAKDADNTLGVYAVYRNQRNINVSDGGKATDVVVVDAAGKWEFFKRRNRVLKVGFEALTINGTTTQARNENAALLRVQQFGAAAKVSYRLHRLTLLADWGFASGDQNPQDDRIENFRFDRDFKVGLVLFDQVMAYQSARSGVRASDPNLVGIAPEGADLLGTAGSVTGVWYLFPRVKYGLFDWLDVYGGPLFAFSTARLADPFNTRIGGGTAVNPVGGRPGMYMGTEVDLGVQARYRPIPELLITATGEGGLFLPGDAYTLPTGGVMGPVGFGRLRLSIAL